MTNKEEPGIDRNLDVDLFKLLLFVIAVKEVVLEEVVGGVKVESFKL